MAVETDNDLAAFFSPDEFGANCILQPKAGGAITFSGIVSKYHQMTRPGEPAKSSISPFAIGAADMNNKVCQLLARFDIIGAVKPDDTVTVLSGPFAGEYRVRDPQQDGMIIRLQLNRI